MYNNFPYKNYYPNMYNIAKIPGKGKNFTWNGFLSNAERTLNVINQAMPIYKEVKPVVKNIGTIFRVIGNLNTNVASTAVSSTITNSPTFFA